MRSIDDFDDLVVLWVDHNHMVALDEGQVRAHLRYLRRYLDRNWMQHNAGRHGVSDLARRVGLRRVLELHVLQDDFLDDVLLLDREIDPMCGARSRGIGRNLQRPRLRMKTPWRPRQALKSQTDASSSSFLDASKKLLVGKAYDQFEVPQSVPRAGFFPLTGKRNSVARNSISKITSAAHMRDRGGQLARTYKCEKPNLPRRLRGAFLCANKPKHGV